MFTSIHLEWYQWLAVLAAAFSIVLGAIRFWLLFFRKPQQQSPPSLSQRGKFNQNIIVNGGSGSPNVEIQTNIRNKQ
jgi:hypothetical protein